MGSFCANGKCNPELESIDRPPHSPGMDDVGEILLPQELVDEILNDVKVDMEIGEGDAVKDKIVDEVYSSDINFYELKDTPLVDVVFEVGEMRSGDIQVQVSGFDTGKVVKNGGDHLDTVGSRENIDKNSSDMYGVRMGGVRNMRCRTSIHGDTSEAALRKEKRKIACRVAAAKSHAGKQAQLKMLESNVMNLKKENLLKEKSLQFLKGIPNESTIRFQLRRTSSL